MTVSNSRTVANLGVVLGLVLLGGCGHGRTGGSVTKENADKIHVGMIEQDVVAILGSPTDSAEIALPNVLGSLGGKLSDGVELPTKAKQSNWRDGAKVISVTFADGKVLGTLFNDSTHATAMPDAGSKTAGDTKSAGLDDPPFTQSGGFDVVANQEGVVNFAIPYALAPNVEISGADRGSVVITECKATGFKWKGVTAPRFSSGVTWTAKGIKATKLPEGDAK